MQEELKRNSSVTQVEFGAKIEKNLGYFFIKRVIDIIGALCGIIIISPIMIVVGIWIKLDSKGPVFFAQNRVGQDGRRFLMYKFRSMCTDA